MRDPRRIDRISSKLRAHWHAHPDLRLGQLLVNLTPTAVDSFYMEDDVLEAALDSHLRPGGPR